MTFLFGLPGVLLGLARRAFGFLRTLAPFQLLSLALAALSAFFWAQRNDARHDAAKWKGLTVQLNAARDADRLNFIAAGMKAEAANKAQVAADEAHRANISKESNDAYQSQLAALRADFSRRMRAQAGADQGRPGNGSLSPLPDAASRPDGQAVPSDQPDLLYVAETELQLNALIDWTRRQAAIDPNAPR